MPFEVAARDANNARSVESPASGKKMYFAILRISAMHRDVAADAVQHEPQFHEQLGCITCTATEGIPCDVIGAQGVRKSGD